MLDWSAAFVVNAFIKALFGERKREREGKKERRRKGSS